MSKGLRAGLVGVVGVVVLQLGCSELDQHGMRTLFHPLADEAYIRFEVVDRSELDWLTRIVSIDRAHNGQVWAYASSAQLDELARQGYSWEGLPHPGVNPDAPMGFFDKDGNKQWDHFPTYSEYVAAMQQYADDYPNLCRLHDLGPSNNQNRPHNLLVLEITDNPDVDEDEPEVLYTSTMHGDETTGIILTLHLIDDLLTQYGSDPELTEMVDNMEIWINPMHNPDGTYYGGDQSVGSAIRSYVDSDGSSSWIDPNRNFPDLVYGDHPDGSSWWTETVTMMHFAEDRSFVLAANYHGGAEVVNYPWDCQYDRHADDAWWQEVSHEYADHCQADGDPSYMTDYNDGITNGYDWYSIHGGRMDYMNYQHGCRETTLEVSNIKNPSESSLDFYWTANRQAMLDWLKRALAGIRGRVTNQAGQPLPATVEVLNVDNADTPHVFTDPLAGDYHRLLLPGNYDLRFSSEGYVTKDVAGVVVTSGDATRVDVVLSGTSRTDIFGQVISLSNQMPLPGVTVKLVDSGVEAAVTSRSGYYSFPSINEGMYTFRISAPGYETIEEKRNITLAESQADFGIFMIQEALNCDLELDTCGLTTWGNPVPGWEWGSQASNPVAHSGTRLWATALEDQYNDNATWYLELDDIWIPKNEPVLSFWHWYEMEPTYDGGNLKISTDGGQSYSLLTPLEDYPENDISALGQPGFSGASSGWVKVNFDLSDYAGRDVSIRWEFASDGSEVRQGWYIDDLIIYARVPDPAP